jgi:hypothetical protein
MSANTKADFDLNIHNYNFNEMLNLFKIHDIGSDDKKYYKYKMDEKLAGIKEKYSKEIYKFFYKSKMIILSIFNLLHNNIIKNNNNEIEGYVNYLKNMKNLEVYIDREDELYSKLVNDNQYKIKIIDSDENTVTNSVFNLNLNTPYKNTNSGRVDPSLNGKNNTNFIVNSQINEISPGDLNSVKRITQLFNLNLNSCFRNNYYQSNPCDFLYMIPSEIKNVTAMRLVSIEIPNSWYLFSNLKKNNVFEIVFNVPASFNNNNNNNNNSNNHKTHNKPHPQHPQHTTCAYVIEIPEGNYDTETLQDFLNSTYFYQAPSSSEYKKTYLKYIKFSINKYNLKTTFELVNLPKSATSSNHDDDDDDDEDEIFSEKDRLRFSLKFSQGINQNIMNTFGWIVGFRSGNYINIDESITSEGLFDAGGDRYIYVCINDFQYNNNPLNMVCFDKSVFNEDVIAKIPMVNGKLSLIINDNNNALAKVRRYNGPVNLSRLQIKIVDHFGTIIDLNNMDFSMTIELQLLYENFNFKNVTY